MIIKQIVDDGWRTMDNKKEELSFKAIKLLLMDEKGWTTDIECPCEILFYKLEVF